MVGRQLVVASYTRRPWPDYEWAVANQEADRREQEFILPLRVDDSRLFGLSSTVAYLDLRELELDQVADILIQKLDGFRVTTDTKPAKSDWVATFGLNVEDLHAHQLSPHAPSDTPLLYDWLADDLIERLTKQTAPQPVQVAEDLRTGETLSVRVKFVWDPDNGSLDFGDLGWWGLLELRPYAAVYKRDETP